jgi:hypothetical protein
VLYPAELTGRLRRVRLRLPVRRGQARSEVSNLSYGTVKRAERIRQFLIFTAARLVESAYPAI